MGGALVAKPLCVIFMLEIRLQEFEQNEPVKKNYYYIEVDIQDGKFSGWTECVFTENNWDNFISELMEFLKFERDKVIAFTGWGDEKYFAITFSFKDKSGQIFISVEVGYPVIGLTSSNPPISHKCSFTFETDLISIEKFTEELKSLKNLRIAVLK